MTDQSSFAVRTLLQRIAGAWQAWRQQRAAAAELAACGTEADLIAHDLKMSRSELRGLAGMSHANDALLAERMISQGLDPVVISYTNSAVMQDLQRTCSYCRAKGRCARDLASDAGAVASYCPNEQTLKALRTA